MEDCFIVCHAKDLGLPLSAGLVVYGKVWTDLGLSTSEVKGSLARFALINQKKDGFLSINDLAGFIGVSDGSVRDIFAAEVRQQLNLMIICSQGHCLEGQWFE